MATGVQVSRAAQQLPGYDRWPYRSVLDQHIVEASENATRFNQEPAASGRVIMFASACSCMGCHQAR